MRTSARNVLAGTIAWITPGAVNGEVGLSIGGKVDIVSIITQQSIADLRLKVGMAAKALIPSSFVILAKGSGFRTSARNHIPAKVAERRDGAVNSEIALNIDAGQPLVSTITIASADHLDLKAGDEVIALIKAPHIIIAVE